MTIAYTNTKYKVQLLDDPKVSEADGMLLNWETVNKEFGTQEGMFTSLASAISFCDTLEEFLKTKDMESLPDDIPIINH